MALINWHNKINSWSDFKNLLDTKTKQEKGQAFEEFLDKINKNSEFKIY
jgi:hypothetical protein